MNSPTAGRVGLAGSAVVGVAFGMARYAYGLTLPDVRHELGLPDLVLGFIASGTFVGYLTALLLSGPLAAYFGPRAPTTVGGVCGMVGSALVAVAPSAGLLTLGTLIAGSAAGWVWAPYSDIVSVIAPAAQRPRLLAVITTGTSGGLVLLGLTAMATAGAAWRLTWVCIAVASGVAAMLNLRWVPKLRPGSFETDLLSRRPLMRRALARPLVYAVAYFATCTVYFTYASDAARSGGLAAAAGPVLYIVLGLTGLVALWAGRMVIRFGVSRVAACSVVAAGVALALLGADSGSIPIVLVSSAIFGIGYMTGSAVLSIWTAEAVADRPSAGFTAALVVGAASSIATPAVIGALITILGLPTLLLLTAAGAILTAAALPLRAAPANATRVEQNKTATR
jgi:predicted MFS family arabinose efflux permease